MEHGVAVLDDYHPIAGLALLVVAAVLAYVAVSYLIDGAVSVLATVVFAVLFTAVYAGVTYYQEEWNRSSPD